MRIEKIILDNFRCFEHKEIHFHPQFNVIIGENGLGKTAVTDAIAYLLKPYLFAIMGGDEKAIIQKSDIRRIRFGRTEDVSEENTCLSISLENILTRQERQTTSWIVEATINNQSDYQAQNGMMAVMKVINQEPQYVPIIAHYPANRISPQTSEIETGKLAPNGSRKIGYQNALDNKNIDIQLITARINTLEYAIYTKSKYAKDDPSLHGTRSELNAIQDAIINCIPDATEIGFNPEWNELMVHFKDEEPKPFSMLSEGFRNMLAIVGDIAHRCARLNPDLNENILTETEGIVIIDEIDLHVHPNWQRNIVGNLKKTFPKIQFIVTTHSPFIVQSLKKEELINLQENAEASDTDPFRKSIEEVADNEMGVLDVQRSQLFLAMEQSAMDFFDLVKKGINGNDLALAKQKLDELTLLYSDDAAYTALLKSELPQLS